MSLEPLHMFKHLELFLIIKIGPELFLIIKIGPLIRKIMMYNNFIFIIFFL